MSTAEPRSLRARAGGALSLARASVSPGRCPSLSWTPRLSRKHRALRSSFTCLDAKAASEGPEEPDPGDIQAPGKRDRRSQTPRESAAVQLDGFLPTKLHRQEREGFLRIWIPRLGPAITPEARDRCQPRREGAGVLVT